MLLTAVALFIGLVWDRTSASAQTGAAVSGSATMRQRAADHFDLEVLEALSGRQAIRASAEERQHFWAWDFHQEHYYQLEADLVHVSPDSWIYVERGAQVSGLAVGRLAETFEDRILPVLRTRYGSEPSPGVDGQDAVTLLLLDIRDDLYHGAEPFQYVSGYFDPINQLAGDTAPSAGHHGNVREMIYLDVSPTDPEGPVLRQSAAHEFAHLVGWGYDPLEDTWLAEGIGQLAIHIVGLGHPREQLLAFLARPETGLTTWHGDVRDYGKTYLFALYLYEQLGGHRSSAITRLVQDPARGLPSVAALLPPDRPLDSLVRDFGLALHFDDLSFGDGRFGFQELELTRNAMPGDDAFPLPAARHHPRGAWPDGSTVDDLPAWSIRADRFETSGTELEIELIPSAPVCLGAGWQTRTRDARYETLCIPSVRPGPWLLRPDGDPRSVTTIAVNASEEPVVMRVSGAPLVATQGDISRVHLPFAMRR